MTTTPSAAAAGDTTSDTRPANTHAAGRPEPVASAAAIAGAVAGVLIALGGLLRLFGLLPVSVDVEAIADQASNMVLAVAVLWSVTGPWLLAMLRARDKVTPLESHRGADGVPLITTTQATELAETAADAAWTEAWTKAHAAALEQARDEYHAALQAPADDPGRHASTG